MIFLPNTGQGWAIDVYDETWRFDPSGRLLTPSDPNTYDPCWCRSGEKFRFCHLNRHRLPRVTNAEFLAGWEAAADLEMCLHPNAPKGCSEGIIRAHTVQRMGGGLRTIALDGQVYGLREHPRFFQKNDMRVVPELIGTRAASTFRGFCASHDASLFEPVELYPFTPTVEQMLLLDFRVIARRVFTKRISVRHARTMFDYDRGLPSDVQREFFAVQYRQMLEVDHHLNNILALKMIYDRRVLSRNFSDVNALIVEFDGQPDFACAAMVNIEADFAGNALEHPTPPAHLCAYTVGLERGWAFVFSWVGPNSAAEALCRSLLETSDSDKGRLVLSYVIEHIDTIYFAPRWWDQLVGEDRAIVINRLTARSHPHYVRDRKIFTTGKCPLLSSRFVRYQQIGTLSVTK